MAPPNPTQELLFSDRSETPLAENLLTWKRTTHELHARVSENFTINIYQRADGYWDAWVNESPTFTGSTGYFVGHFLSIPAAKHSAYRRLLRQHRRRTK